MAAEAALLAEVPFFSLLNEDERATLASQIDVVRHPAGHILFTVGDPEVRAWTIRKGATAPQAAGAIHTDFEKGFIRAEVIAYDDYVRLNGEAAAKEAGKMRLEGKEYVVKDGDVMHFRFNV